MYIMHILQDTNIIHHGSTHLEYIALVTKHATTKTSHSQPNLYKNIHK